MRIPESLTALAEEGIIDEVLRPLMSGKEAQVFLVRCGDEERVAKVYKDAEHRTFKQRAEYTEGRKVRNSRDQRALAKGSRYGRQQDEATWRATEVEMIQRLHAAGVRVPTPYNFIDGVLIMEMISDADGNPAARLGDVQCDRATALEIYDQLLREVIRMLCAGVVHGDLSDFNVLLDAAGPVIIDFPQAVNAAGNTSARKLLLRDVDNLHRWVTRIVPERQRLPYAEEMWQLYQRGELTPDVKLTGRFRASETKVDTRDLLGLVADAERDERRRRQRLGPNGGPAPIRKNQPVPRGNANPSFQNHHARGHTAHARNQWQGGGRVDASSTQTRDSRNRTDARGSANTSTFQHRGTHSQSANTRNQVRDAHKQSANAGNERDARRGLNMPGPQSRQSQAPQHQASARHQQLTEGVNGPSFERRGGRNDRGQTRTPTPEQRTANEASSPRRDGYKQRENAMASTSYRRDATTHNDHERGKNLARGDVNSATSKNRAALDRTSNPSTRSDARRAMQNHSPTREHAHGRGVSETHPQNNAKRSAHASSDDALPAKVKRS